MLYGYLVYALLRPEQSYWFYWATRVARADDEGVHCGRMSPFAIVPLFMITAVAEIVGCYLVFLWARDERSPLLLVGAAVSLGVFAWLLSFHPNAGRAYAAYGGVYVALAVAWGWLVEKQSPDRWDLIGAAVCLIGMTIITFGPRT